MELPSPSGGVYTICGIISCFICFQVLETVGVQAILNIITVEGIIQPQSAI